MSLIDRMREAKAALHEAEAAHPDSPALEQLHRKGRRLVTIAKRMGLITPAQADELETPPGAGGPKTPEPDDE